METATAGKGAKKKKHVITVHVNFLQILGQDKKSLILSAPGAQLLAYGSGNVSSP